MRSSRSRSPIADSLETVKKQTKVPNTIAHTHRQPAWQLRQYLYSLTQTRGRAIRPAKHCEWPSRPCLPNAQSPTTPQFHLCDRSPTFDTTSPGHNSVSHFVHTHFQRRCYVTVSTVDRTKKKLCFSCCVASCAVNAHRSVALKWMWVADFWRNFHTAGQKVLWPRLNWFLVSVDKWTATGCFGSIIWRWAVYRLESMNCLSARADLWHLWTCYGHCAAQFTGAPERFPPK